MATFKVLAGGPVKIDGRLYKAGENVKHNADLTKLFQNRFELVSGTPGVLEDDEDPTPVENVTPFDVSTTRRSRPAALQPTEGELPPEANAPVTRPANAPKGGTSDEGGGETPDEEAPSDEEEADTEGEDTEPARTTRRAPARTTARTTRTTTTRKRG